MIDLDAKMSDIERQYDELSRSFAESRPIGDGKAFREQARRHAELGRIVEKWKEVRKARQRLEESRALTDDPDPELAEMAREEADEARQQMERLEQELNVLLLPRDPNDERNVLLEIRAGTGGEEAALFARDLFRMYSRFAERHGWKSEILSLSEAEAGGIKEVIAAISGDQVYSHLKFESGTHRVQRVPNTEASGRIHTSAATVAILPEANEVDVAIKPEDLKITVQRSSGPGGQSVNTTDSSVRVTHIPTGMIVICQDEKSQHKNRAKALKVLRSRLLEMEQERQQAEISADRRRQVGTGDRSQKIRTYNFPQNRVTDHRIQKSIHRLGEVLDGDLDELIEALALDDQTRLLAAAGG